MVNRNYQKGYRFQQRVKKFLEKKGYFVVIQPKSAFPDGLAVKGIEVPGFFYHFDCFFFECKWNKYLSKEEKEKARKLGEKYKFPFIVYWNNKRKIDQYLVYILSKF